jgi:hypothetical protein
LNDLIIYSDNLILTNSPTDIKIKNICNLFKSDVKSLLVYLSDTIDNIQQLQFITNNSSSINSTQLLKNLTISSFNDFTIKGINDYNLEYFNSNTVYNSLNSFRSTYQYNIILNSIDTDVQNYYNFLVSLYNVSNIGKSLKFELDNVINYNQNNDIYYIVNNNNKYGKIILDEVSNIKLYLQNEQNSFSDYYNQYIKNINILNISDELELNTINNSIKSLNINSKQYVQSLSSTDQFSIYNRNIFGYNIDTYNDIIYDLEGTITHPFFIANSEVNFTNKEYYNRPILDTFTYDIKRKTYEYQIKRIQSYFFNKVHGSIDSDMNYLKDVYALENYDNYKYNPILISQVNKQYNYDLPSYIIDNISSLTKLDNNFNTEDYNSTRILNNSAYYIETLKILDYLIANSTITTTHVSYMNSFLANSVIYTDYILNCENNQIKNNTQLPYSLTNRGNVSYISSGTDNLIIPIINLKINKSPSFNIQNYNTTNYFDFFYLNFLYLLFDLYILDGNMRISWSKISDKNNIKFFKNDSTYSFATCYKTLINEYFYLILRGKNIYQNSLIVNINYSYINDIILSTKNYDILLEHLLYSSYNNESYDLFDVSKNYKIENIQNNHHYSENYAKIFSIKNSFNDKNFENLINLTNYNNKYLAYSSNFTNVSNIQSVQTSFLNTANINNSYSFYGNIIVTNYDYNNIKNSNIINSNIYNATFGIESTSGNLKINMNDIANIKKEIMKYYLTEITNSNLITSTTYLNGNISEQELSISNLKYNGNIISHMHVYPDKKYFSIQKYDNADSNFNPSNINSLTLWLDSKDTSNIFKDVNGTQVITNGDKIGKWQNKASTGDYFTISNDQSDTQPTWSNCVSFNGSTFLKSNIHIESTSSIYMVTDIPNRGGFYLYFDNGNFDNTTNGNVGPVIYSDGKSGNYIYNDYTFNIEETFSLNTTGRNILSTERINGSSIMGYVNGFNTFSNYNKNKITSNVKISSFPGYLDKTNILSESITGNIYEILIFNKVLSYDDRYNINRYLSRKWGFVEKIEHDDKVQYYDFPFDYLPKLYDYNVSNGNIVITHNHYFDQNFSNIYNNVYLEYRNLYNDINYKISNIIDISNIVNYMYFSDFISDINTLVINNDFVYNLDLNSSTFNISNSYINIDSNILINYKEYIKQIDAYKLTFNIKDSFDFITNSLKYDTNYIKYTLMNFGSIFNSDANIFHQKVGKLIEKTNYFPFNTNDRIYNFNEIVTVFYNITSSGKFNYEQLQLGNSYIGNTKLPLVPYNNKYVIGNYNFYDYQSGGDANVLILNDVLDINNRKDNLEDEKIRLYENILSEINKTYGDIANYNLVNLLVAQVKLRPEQALVAWIEKLGFYIADYFELYIGGEIIERIESDFMNIGFEIAGKSELRKAVRKMIGQDKSLVVKKTQLGTYLLYIDIPFYFNRYRNNHAMSIPLIALIYNKLHLKFKLKDINKLLNMTNYASIKRTTKFKMTLMLDYILLDLPERQKFAESKHEYLIEQVQYSTFTSTNQNITNQIKLNFKNPTKIMLWYAQTLSNINKNEYYNYTLDDYYLEINKYIEADQISNPYLTEASKILKHLINKLLSRNTSTNTVYNKLDITKMPYENYSKYDRLRLSNSVKPKSNPLIKQTELKVNGHTRFKASSDESQLIRPYTYFNNSYTNGINVYNFGLYPIETQPSGSINFSFLNDINLLIDFNNIPQQEVKINIMTVSYNLLRIMSGYGGLAFDTI